MVGIVEHLGLVMVIPLLGVKTRCAENQRRNSTYIHTHIHMACFLKCDRGQPSTEFVQAGTGLEAVRETSPISDTSWEV